MFLTHINYRNLRKKNILDPGLAKPQFKLNLEFKNTDLGQTIQNNNNSNQSLIFEDYPKPKFLVNLVLILFVIPAKLF